MPPEVPHFSNQEFSAKNLSFQAVMIHSVVFWIVTLRYSLVWCYALEEHAISTFSLKMEAGCSSEMLVTTYWTTWCHNPEDRNMRLCRMHIKTLCFNCRSVLSKLPLVILLFWLLLHVSLKLNVLAKYVHHCNYFFLIQQVAKCIIFFLQANIDVTVITIRSCPCSNPNLLPFKTSTFVLITNSQGMCMWLKTNLSLVWQYPFRILNVNSGIQYYHSPLQVFFYATCWELLITSLTLWCHL
jgi:hypothetical protein